jgi:hypothetical protein
LQKGAELTQAIVKVDAARTGRRCSLVKQTLAIDACSPVREGLVGAATRFAHAIVSLTVEVVSLALGIAKHGRERKSLVLAVTAPLPGGTTQHVELRRLALHVASLMTPVMRPNSRARAS